MRAKAVLTTGCQFSVGSAQSKLHHPRREKMLRRQEASLSHSQSSGRWASVSDSVGAGTWGRVGARVAGERPASSGVQLREKSRQRLEPGTWRARVPIPRDPQWEVAAIPPPGPPPPGPAPMVGRGLRGDPQLPAQPRAPDADGEQELSRA